MIRDPKEQAIQQAITAITGSSLSALGASLPGILAKVYDVGYTRYGADLQAAMQSMSPPLNPISVVSPTQTSTPAAPLKDGRAPHGSVRKAVIALLVANGPMTAATIKEQLPTVDAGVSGVSAINELNRQKDKLYVNDGGVWSLVPGLKLGGDFFHLQDQESLEGDEATGPGQV